METKDREPLARSNQVHARPSNQIQSISPAPTVGSLVKAEKSQKVVPARAPPKPQTLGEVQAALAEREASITAPALGATGFHAARRGFIKKPRTKRRVYTFQEKLSYVQAFQKHGLDYVLSENPHLRKESLQRWVTAHQNGVLQDVKRGPKPRADRDFTVTQFLADQGVSASMPIGGPMLVNLKHLYCKAYPEQSLASVTTFRKAVIRVRDKACLGTGERPGEVSEPPPSPQVKVIQPTAQSARSTVLPPFGEEDLGIVSSGLYISTSVPEFGASGASEGHPTLRFHEPMERMPPELDPKQFVRDLALISELVSNVQARGMPGQQLSVDDKAALQRAITWMSAVAVNFGR
ncbi:hypothetical protein J8273_2015 [Carpediemonas membranifera]|uniref:Uncharacterized protein n=1 Tax=Carpediemonas membranifera TaxID=201153 RepID=A0A8J6B9W8_9EUKA|nr:hypothetical protein J8273_2015 [Carpediemonas membranifera]|eukprot:KAG9396284.1 hypothetical protein J8273_2015 [Carpediemonas membranifera]